MSSERTALDEPSLQRRDASTAMATSDYSDKSEDLIFQGKR